MTNNSKTTLSDDKIIEFILESNDSRGFEQLYNRYYKKVVDKCYSFLKNRHQAEDMANDVMSKAYEKLSTFKSTASFSSWLYSITYNHCIDFLRLKKKLHYPEWNQENALPEIIDDTDEDFTELNYKNLMSVFELIHPEEKAMLLMKYQDGISIKDISIALRISESAAKMRIKRAKTRAHYVYKEKYNESL